MSIFASRINRKAYLYLVNPVVSQIIYVTKGLSLLLEVERCHEPRTLGYLPH
jgi:hypothetical protein